MKTANVLRKELSDKKITLSEVRGAERKGKEIKKKIAENRQKEEEILKKIPKNKKSMFILMKELTAIGNSMGIKDISFVMEGVGQKENKPSTRSIMRKRRNPHMFDNPEGTGSGSIIPRHFTMSFAASYMEVYVFVKKILSIERVISLESIEIERNKDYFPRQKTSLKLITYTFPDSKK